MATLGIGPTLALAALVASSAPSVIPGPVPARVERVVDGDTLAVRARIWPGLETETRVRIFGIDAPELRSRCRRERALARAAKRYLADRVGIAGEAFHLSLRDIRWDKFGGRVIARVEGPDGQDLGRALITAGLARPYGGRAKPRWC